MLPLVLPHLYNLQSYVPGKALSEVRKEYGITDLIKLASNENCLGPSPHAMEAVQKSFFDAHLYPIEHREKLKEAIVDYLGSNFLQTKNIVLGNGSNELINLFARFFVSSKESILNAWPSFLMYRNVAKANNLSEESVPLTIANAYDLETMLAVANGPRKDKIKLVFIANPNNPIGPHLAKEEINNFLNHAPEHLIVVLDEAYAEYVCSNDYESALDWVVKRPRTIVLRTFSKIFGLAGLRLGFAVCPTDIANILHQVRDPFNINGIAQVAAIAALKDKEHIKNSQQNNEQELRGLHVGLNKLKIVTTSSSGNFVLMHLNPHNPPTKVVIENLLKLGVIVRGLDNYDLPNAIRVTVGTPPQNKRFLNSLKEVLSA